MSDEIIKVIMVAVLLACVVQDILKKKVWLGFILVGMLLIGACIPFSNSLTLLDRFAGSAVGISVVLISLATKGKIGMGDGILLCITGLGLGFWGNLELFAIALLMAA